MRRNLLYAPVLILLAILFACKSVEVAPADKEMFVRGQDLFDFGVEVQDPEKYEKFDKTKYFDGSEDIEYEFEPPDTEAVMYLAETITYEPKKSDARFGRAAGDSVIGLALRTQGLEMVEVPNFYQYGDSSNFYALKKDGENVGNYFTVLEEGKVFSFLVSGIYFDDADIWREVVEPRLKNFSSYKRK